MASCNQRQRMSLCEAAPRTIARSIRVQRALTSDELRLDARRRASRSVFRKMCGLLVDVVDISSLAVVRVIVMKTCGGFKAAHRADSPIFLDLWGGRTCPRRTASSVDPGTPPIAIRSSGLAKNIRDAYDAKSASHLPRPPGSAALK